MNDCGCSRRTAAFLVGEHVFWVVLGAIALVALIVGSAPVRETDQQRRMREAAERKRADEEKKRAAARKTVQDRKRADAVAARVAAFRELKNIVDEKVRAEIIAGQREKGTMAFSAPSRGCGSGARILSVCRLLPGSASPR